MPQVPVLNPEVRAQVTPSYSAPSMARPPAEAFGTNIAQAQEKQGQAIQNVGDVLTKHMIDRQEREDAQRVLDLQTQFQSDVQNRLLNSDPGENNVPKGYLQRSLNNAKGATVQFDQEAHQIKKQYMDMAVGENEREAMNKILSAHLLASRESIVAHEANETQKAFDKSFQTNLKTTVENAAGIDHPGILGEYIDAAYLSASGGWKHSGLDEAGIEAAKKGLAGEITKAAVIPLLESDPKGAQAMLDAAKDRMTPLQAAEIQNQVTGKIIHEQQMDTWNAVKGYRLSDGMVDVAQAQKYVDGLELPAARKEQIFSFVRSMASVADAELKQKREADTRIFTNELVTAQAKGMPYNDALLIAAKYGYDSTDIAAKQKIVTDLYADKVNRFDTWLSKQPQATQAAWNYAEEAMKATYGYGKKKGEIPGYPEGVKVKLADAAIDELKNKALGKSPEQIRQLAGEMTKEVVTKPRWFWFDKTAPSWQVDAEVRQGLAAATAQLEQTYGADRVSQARTFLIRNNVPVTPLNIKKALDSAQKDK